MIHSLEKEKETRQNCVSSLPGVERKRNTKNKSSNLPLVEMGKKERRKEDKNERGRGKALRIEIMQKKECGTLSMKETGEGKKT